MSVPMGSVPRVPAVGSDSGKVYVGQESGPPYAMTVEQARHFAADLLWHIGRAIGGDDAWNEEQD